ELEASLFELELILRLRPDANRRSVNPERSCYLTLTTDERVPRVSVTSEPRPGAISAGPLRGRGGGDPLVVPAPQLPARPAGGRRQLPGRAAGPVRGTVPRRRRGGRVRPFGGGRRRLAARRGRRHGGVRPADADGDAGSGSALRGGGPAARPAGGARARANRAGPAARRGRPQRGAAGGRH